MSILVVTTDDVANARTLRIMGPVFGTAIRSRTALGDRLGAMRALFGGSQSGYIRMLNETRTQAIEALKADAASHGANAVLAMRFDSGQFGSGQGENMAEMTAYGTAAVIEPLN